MKYKEKFLEGFFETLGFKTALLSFWPKEE